MAKMVVDGTEFVTEKMGRLSRETIKSITMAGANAAEQCMADNTRKRQHVRTGDMLAAIGNTGYVESYQGGSTWVYPQGEDSQGQRNATKAYVTNYGKGQRPYTKRPRRNPQRNRTGDKYITGNEKSTEQAVHAAMQAECDRLSEEIDKG